ncbi:MAG TPA: DNA mismatch repair endonuclease MutL [Desulfitobacteriaceae bacterium]|nr:DNA mismatch repair endonuclease MutL [Desulfitobacteriaceae bacterium]
MKPVIRILDQHSANQIAAGEVVERPVSVVKELIENALDAKAYKIDITIEQNGLPLIRVSDNGCGIEPADLPLAVLRHATSKISGIRDLEQLHTLGFRGEALPSIASVSRLEISSRPPERLAGSCLTLEGGQQADIQEIGCPAGTSIVVRDLFFNAPARKKFLKSLNTEFGLISDIVSRLALARPEVAFSLAHPRQIILQTSGRGSWLNTIGEILGNDIARRLIPVSATSGNWVLEGFISPPELVRSSKQGETFIINGRYIRSAFLNRALLAGYHTLIPAKQYPIAILHLHLPPSEYDVNVHPTKMDIRFREEKDLAGFLEEAIRKTLLQSRSLPGWGKAGIPAAREIIPQVSGYLFPTASPAPIPDIRENTVSSGSGDYAATELRPGQPSEPVQILPDSLEQDQAQVSLFASASPRPGPLEEFRPLAQLFQTYVLASDGKVLMIIDQHAAHERINYERLLKKAKQNPAASQQLLTPVSVELTLQEEQALLEHLESISELGFILEHFGPKTYLLRGIPAYVGPFSAEELLRKFIEQVLQQNKIPVMEQLLGEWIYLLACHESIKAQDTLSLAEMEQLLVQLGQTENPFTCPHGRPTMIQMTAAELAKRFYRG